MTIRSTYLSGLMSRYTMLEFEAVATMSASKCEIGSKTAFVDHSLCPISTGIQRT